MPTTRRIYIEQPAPVGESFTRVVTRPRWTGWPFRRFRCEPVGERAMLVTRHTTISHYPIRRTARIGHVRVHRFHRAVALHRGERRVVFTRRALPVAQRVAFVRHHRVLR